MLMTFSIYVYIFEVDYTRSPFHLYIITSSGINTINYTVWLDNS